MAGTYSYIVGIFGFIFLALTFVIAGEIITGFEVWVVGAASGYDTNILTFFQQYWFFLPIISLFAIGLWVYNENQKTLGDYR